MIDSSITRQLHAIRSKVIRYFVDLNLFRDTKPTDDPQEIQNQRLSSKAVILLFLVSLYILFIYTATATSVRTFTVDMPSHDQFNKLPPTICPNAGMSLLTNIQQTRVIRHHRLCSTSHLRQHVRSPMNGFTILDGPVVQ